MTSRFSQLSDNLRNRLENLIIELATDRSCLQCEHFDEPNERCAAAGGQRPPARVIVLGCPSWSGRPPF